MHAPSIFHTAWWTAQYTAYSTGVSKCTLYKEKKKEKAYLLKECKHQNQLHNKCKQEEENSYGIVVGIWWGWITVVGIVVVCWDPCIIHFNYKLFVELEVSYTSIRSKHHFTKNTHFMVSVFWQDGSVSNSPCWFNGLKGSMRASLGQSHSLMFHNHVR